LIAPVDYSHSFSRSGGLNFGFSFYPDVITLRSGICRCNSVCLSSVVCLYVCMSEDLYPARLKQSHRCAAVSNKNVFNVCLKRLVDRSTERKEVGEQLESLYITFVHLTHPIEIFGNIFTPFCTLPIR